MYRRVSFAVCLAASLGVVSCFAPITVEKVSCKSPSGDFTVSPLSDALRELEAGKKRKRDPLVAAGHYVQSARLAGDLALKGEDGALALYNQSVGLLVETLGDADALPWGSKQAVTVGEGSATWSLAGKLEPGAPSVAREYVSVETLEFDGNYAKTRAVRAGVGAPLVAISDNPDALKTYDMAKPHVALTAVLRFGSGKSATLELHDPLDTERISIAGRNPVLAADYTAPVGMFMALARPDKLGLIRMLDPHKYSATARLTRIQKYDKNRIPVVFVHGLDSTPATWAPMYASLMADPEIRNRYQFWVYSYPSGYPYFYSASLLRRDLEGVKKVFPDHKDVVLVGHSMGGIMSRLMVTDAGDVIWRALFNRPPSETKVSGASRKVLEDSLVFRNVPTVKRAVFVAAPHRGSTIATNWIGRLGSRLVRLPGFLTDTRNAVASVLTADNASLNLSRAPNSIDTLAPNNRFVREVNKLPIAPGVTYHSIIGDRGKGNTPESSDGVVPYWSSHMAGAASEKIVPAGHSAHQHPQAYEEMRRILRLHLGRKG